VVDGVRAQLAIHADPGINGLRIRLSGELDEAGAGRLIHTVLDDLPPEHQLIIDFAHVTFCDSSGMNAMVQLRNHQAVAGDTLLVINLPGPVRRVFDLSGLVGFLDMADPEAHSFGSTRAAP
jgi:anti-anti-sigma factor